MSKKKIGYILLSLIVSAVLIWILLRQVDTKDFLYTFSNIFLPTLLTFFAISLFGTVLRAWRYKLLLYPQKISRAEMQSLWGFNLRIAVISNGIHLVTNLFENILCILSIPFLALQFSKK